MGFKVRNQQDFAAGLMFIAIAVGGLAVAWHYPVGTAIRMNAGYFPRILCLLLGLLGLVVLAGSLRKDGPKLTAVSFRPLVLVPAAVVAFGLGIQYLGFVLAAVLITIFGSFASAEVRYREVIVTALVLTLLAVGIFIWGVGLPIPLWPEF
ncbi:MAG: tripartite tricarboxylate transporter TctB family protein [Hyphomicrobiales bacterium]|nr:tripartite tricarboxylate transporter TctB family protein [Hyphomicrobiales bacterium]